MAKNDAQGSAVTAHHVNDGPTVFPYETDARSAVALHPDEWSMTPWSPENASAARQRLHERQVEAARAQGREPPAPPTEPVMSDEDRAAFEEWKAAVAKAQAVRDAAAKEKAEQDAKAAELAEAEAVLASPPPPRRPLTGAAKVNADRAAAKKAEAEKAAQDKAEADRQAAAAAAAPGPAPGPAPAAKPTTGL